MARKAYTSSRTGKLPQFATKKYCRLICGLAYFGEPVFSARLTLTILGTAIAKELGVGFIGVRKGDKLPYAKEEIISTHFTDYSGQDKSFEISKSSIVRNKRVLIVDDWIETGSQMKALIALLEKLDCSIIGLATIGIDINEVTQKWIDSSFVAYIGSNI